MTVLGWWGADLALAALAGGLICTASSAWFAMRMFRGGPQADPNKVLRAFYAGEVSKIALTAGLFAVAIIILDLDVLIMFLAYMAATAVYWFALVANVGRQR
jgi:ATP synthase protein I